MGKRLRRGGAGSGMDRSILLRRIKSLNLINSSHDPDLVIQRLRDHYPDYARIKLQPFSVRLREVLQHLRNGSAKPTTAGKTSQSQSFSDGERPSRKKLCKVDVFEERLLRAESEHLRRLQGNYVASSPQTKSSDDSTSTSDDAAFEESIGPEFDVMKSMLREKYVKQSEQNVKKGNVENNVEIEMVANEKRKIGIMMKKGGVSGKEIPVVRLGALDRLHGRIVVSGKSLDRHLGGMKMVLDDLLTEVLVPLCHPELPRKLGVRSIAGILLHGPPGCGKTKLAHAIASATGLPFYKISATEVVSGISACTSAWIHKMNAG